MSKNQISDVLIDFKGDNKDLNDAIDGSKSSLKKLSSVAVSAVKALAAVGVAGVAISAVFSAYSIKQAMTFNQLEKGFKSLVKSQGADADKFLANLQEMSAGTMSMAEIMKNANQAMLLDIDTEAITKMMRGAAGIAQATGQDVGFMFESLAMGIARQSPQLLDNLGIKIKLAEVNDSLADKLNISVGALTDEQKALAFQDAAMEGVSKRLSALGDYVVDTKTKWDQLGAEFKDTTIILGQHLMPEFDKVLDWLLQNSDWMKATFIEIFDIKVTDFGDLTVSQLDKIKDWIDRNKGDIKWWVDSVKRIFEWRAEAAINKDVERADVEERGYGARRKDFYEDMKREAFSGAFPKEEQSTQIVLDHYRIDKNAYDIDLIKASLEENANALRKELGITEYDASRPLFTSASNAPIHQNINISLDAHSVDKFLQGEVIAVTNSSVVSGT